MREIIFLGCVFLATGGLCCLTNAQPGFHRDDDDEHPLPSPMALKRGCNTTADCGENEYCGGRGVIKRCINCFDCEEVKRKQRTNYDGPICATHPTDCGQCNDGYEEYAGLCINKTSFHSTISRVDPYQVPKPNEKAQESNSSTILPIAGAIIVVVFVLSLMLWGCCNQWHSKQGGRFRNEEETGLTQSNTAFEQSPTAPPPPPPTQLQQQQPDEYQRPPPIYLPTPPRRGTIVDECGPHKAKRSRWCENRFRVNERRRGALPFFLGNGASNIIVRDTTYSDDEEVDGGAPANVALHPSNQESRVETGTGWEGNGRTAATPPAAAAVPCARTPNLPSERYVPSNNVPCHPPSHGSPPHGDIPPRHLNDPVHGFVRFAFEMNVAHFNTYNSTRPHHQHPHPPQHLLRNVVSAPPSPRRIEDTHINWEMSEIQSFASPPSVNSIDSGTASGSNDCHHEVPSRFVSRADIHGFSDNEMSLFDLDETMEGNN